MFGAAPGRRIVHADKKQMEIRVMACVANDEVLQKRILSGNDLYETEARGYYNIPEGEKVKKSLRQGAKIGRLARQYGAQEKACFSQAIAADRTMTISRIRSIITLFDKTYWRTVQYWKEETERVAKNGYSESRLLHRRRVYPRMPDLAEIANWPIQATASDIANQEIIELDRRLEQECPDAFLINHVYDSFDVDCDEDEVDKVTAIMREVSHRNYVINCIDFPFGIDLKVTASHNEAWKGDTWASV
jgi:DNA polymerase-1